MQANLQPAASLSSWLPSFKPFPASFPFQNLRNLRFSVPRLSSSLHSSATSSFHARLLDSNTDSPLNDCQSDDGSRSFDDVATPALTTPTLREICATLLPDELLDRAEEVGFTHPTNVQIQALPALLAGQDCVLHSQTGSGKTLCYLLAIFAKVKMTRAAVQAIVVVPTRELGMQVVRAARRLGKTTEISEGDNGSMMRRGTLNIMTLLDGGTSNRQKSWLKASPPQIIVGTLVCICKMIETKNLRTAAINTLVVDEVDAMFGLTKHLGLLRSLLTVHTTAQKRQTIFASATILQHSQFIQKCISEKWVKDSVMYVQANPTNQMPSYIKHCHVICNRDEKLDLLKAVLHADNPNAAIVFVNDQSETAKRKGILPNTATVAEFLSFASSSNDGKDSQTLEPLILEENSNIHARASNLTDFKNGKHLLVATDLAARGLDIPEVSHVYNFDLPPTAVAYVHRGGRTARKPLTYDEGIVTTFVTEQEIFVFQRYQNELLFQSTEININGGLS